MKNEVWGYARVSTKEQNLARQIEQLKEFGISDVRRHIVVGANCILFSVYRPTRLCRIGTYRRF